MQKKWGELGHKRPSDYSVCSILGLLAQIFFILVNDDHYRVVPFLDLKPSFLDLKIEIPGEVNTCPPPPYTLAIDSQKTLFFTDQGSWNNVIETVTHQ